MLQHPPAFPDKDRASEAAQTKFVGTAMARRSLEPFGANHDGVAHHFAGNSARGPTGRRSEPLRTSFRPLLNSTQLKQSRQ
jgi:hypothetical protein